MKILFVNDEGIGNIIQSSPALRAICQTHPDCDLTVFGKYPALDVLRDFPHPTKLITECDEETRYDVILFSIWDNSFHEKYSKDWVRAHTQNAFKAQFSNPDVHESIYHMALARDIGYKSDEVPPPYCGFEQTERVEKIISSISRENGYVCLADTYLNRNWEKKSWGKYPDLAWKCVDAGYGVALVGSKFEQDRFMWSDYNELIHDDVTTAFKLTVPETAWLIRNSAFFVGNDSGPAHIAGAVGAKTFTIFGPTSVVKNKALGDDIYVIRHNLFCQPCQFSSWEGICRENSCLKELPLEFVWESIQQELGGR